MTYACSDIHGNYEVYMRVMKKLSAEDKLYILGDVVDRGTDGVKILQDIMQRDNVELIVGNHEWMMLYSMKTITQTDEFVDNWLRSSNGGKVTLKSLLSLNSEDVEAILNFIASCKLYKKVEVHGLVYHMIHGLYSSCVSETLTLLGDYDDVFTTVWDSPFKGSSISDYASEGIYLHGHVPCIRKTGEVSPLVCKNIIDIDGGLMYGGALILYCLDDQSFELLK